MVKKAGVHCDPGKLRVQRSHPFENVGVLATRRRGRELAAKIAGKVGHNAQALGSRRAGVAERERKFGLKQQTGDRGFELGPDGCGSGHARQGLLAVAAMERGADIADDARDA